VRKAGLIQAADLGLGLFEEVPEGQWKPDELQTFAKDMAYSWLRALPQGDQEAWLDRHATTIKSPSSHLVVGFIEFKVGRRTQALARAAHILSAAPDSFASGMAMMGLLTIHYHRGDLNSGTSALRSFINSAPNNPMAPWGLRCYTWAVCRKDQPQLAYALIDEVVKTKPDTKVAQAATEMRRVLEAIGRRDYAAAFGVLEKIEVSYWYQMVLNDMVLSFVVPAKKVEHRKQLIDAMSQIAATYPQIAARPLAQCIIATTYRVNGQYGQAAQVFEQAFKETQEGEEALVRAAFEGYLLSQLGQVYAKMDPVRAIPYLERFRASYGKNAGAEFYHIALGRAYLQTGKPDKALEMFQWLEDRRKSGEVIASDELKPAIQTGLVASLHKLGRKSEAQVLAGQLLGPYGYGQPASSLTRDKRSKLALYLGMMGRQEEAKQYQP
jgi:tetratricopeptide (TPR) repeat protein